MSHSGPSDSSSDPSASPTASNERRATQGGRLTAPDPKATGAHWSAGWARYLERAIAFRDAGRGDRFLDIWYLDSVKSPVATVEKIYAFLGRELTPVAEEKMRAWTEANAREKRATHAYSLEQFGLSEASIARDFAAYRDRFVENR